MKALIITSLGTGALALGTLLALGSAASPARLTSPAAAVPLEFAHIYWEYNASANDLGVHVTLDGEDWKWLRISNPDEKTLFQVKGSGPYQELGMTELFFEGAEPSLDEFPLQDLLALFPEGEYDFEGRTVDGQAIEGESDFTHAIPDGPDVLASVLGSSYVKISWSPVTAPPPGFPSEPIHVVEYQVIVDPFQVTVPASVLSITLPPEFVAALPAGTYPFEVLAIDQSHNQTLTEGTFTK